MMNLVSQLFGSKPRRGDERISAPPKDVRWHFVRPMGDAKPVHAELAERDGKCRSDAGDLAYKAGEHYLVDYEGGDPAPVKRSIFESTYRRRSDGLYEKRTDIVLRYFTLPYPVIVETLEGDRRAEPRDWIMVGVEGEMWPVPPEDGRRKYEAA